MKGKAPATNFRLFTQFGYATPASFQAHGSSQETDGMMRHLREQSPPKLDIDRHQLASVGHRGQFPLLA
jgi:hypothetical protein